MDYVIFGQSISFTLTAVPRDSNPNFSGSNITDPEADISGRNSTLEQSARTASEAEVAKLLVARELG